LESKVLHKSKELLTLVDSIKVLKS
jgi:hypothetical protein